MSVTNDRLTLLNVQIYHLIVYLIFPVNDTKMPLLVKPTKIRQKQKKLTQLNKRDVQKCWVY